jgi:carbon-monoxide dehydrogenase large subunit
LACDEVRAKVVALAAEMLQTTPSDVELGDGRARAASGTSSIALADLAKASLGAAGTPLKAGQGPGLGGIASYCPPMFTYPTGAHAAIVEVDIATGEVTILKYVAVQDFGNRINPMIVDGQVLGGFAHGLGNALLERVVYDENGQPLVATLADYLLPTARDVPRLAIDYVDNPTPLNPLGIKGAGQGGTIPVPAAIASAVSDALRPLGVRVHRVPVTPVDLLAAIKARAQGSDA